MPYDTRDIALTAHLMRRAGFGATRDELERLTEKGYERIVEELITPTDDSPAADQYLLYRYIPSTETGGPSPAPGAANWLYHMVNTQRPLEEKIALFWHHIFATGNSKVDNDNHLTAQIQLFREQGMGNYRDLLLEVARNPAMIFWLDNNENHKRAPNENWGRELLELFSLGVGHYTEKDVFECARAFTGWTLSPKIPRQPHHRFSWSFEFRPEEHDFGQKTFLGHTGDFDGDDIIDIILQQPSVPASSPGTSTTSSWQTNRRCRRGPSSLRETSGPLSFWPIRSSTPATKSGRSCVSCSTRTSSKRPCTRR